MLVVFLFSFCLTLPGAFLAQAPAGPAPIVLQGAMQIEVESLTERLEQARVEQIYRSATEEMAIASASQIAGLFNVAFPGIRVISDDATDGDPWDPKTSVAGETFVYQVVKAYIATLKR
ncbi:MAG: hypothetical protein ABI652_08845 [Acidobacteriota bacterium]